MRTRRHRRYWEVSEFIDHSDGSAATGLVAEVDEMWNVRSWATAPSLYGIADPLAGLDIRRLININMADVFSAHNF